MRKRRWLSRSNRVPQFQLPTRRLFINLIPCETPHLFSFGQVQLKINSCFMMCIFVSILRDLNAAAGRGQMQRAYRPPPAFPPPANFQCHRCRQRGHWPQACPLLIRTKANVCPTSDSFFAIRSLSIFSDLFALLNPESQLYTYLTFCRAEQEAPAAGRPHLHHIRASSLRPASHSICSSRSTILTLPAQWLLLAVSSLYPKWIGVYVLILELTFKIEFFDKHLISPRTNITK